MRTHDRSVQTYQLFVHLRPKTWEMSSNRQQSGRHRLVDVDLNQRNDRKAGNERRHGGNQLQLFLAQVQFVLELLQPLALCVQMAILLHPHLVVLVQRRLAARGRERARRCNAHSTD